MAAAGCRCAPASCDTIWPYDIYIKMFFSIFFSFFVCKTPVAGTIVFSPFKVSFFP